MQLAASQLQSQHKALIDALKRGETVEITYHGQTLGVVHPVAPTANSAEQEAAMAAFFGMHRADGMASVEKELRTIRKGRRSSLSHSMEMGDALVAATALAHNEMLCTGNIKHFSQVNGLVLEHYSPRG